MKIGNKVINYSVYVQGKKVGDTASVELPEIEILTDSIKGSGIIGEIDLPSPYQAGSMTLSISTRVSNNPDDLALLMDGKDIEVRWVTDALDSSSSSTDIIGHKAFMKCIPKKIGEGKIEPGSGQDGSFEYEVLSYKRVTNGKIVLEIDKLNGIFKVNGVDKTQPINALL
ncbi:phage major tail tube protein [Romboutsia sp. 1001713B170131_170501_G6]|uniref:phage major tail tube protein n=1 Tax=Romboutsia sp. 1001713B170131_170501_G6 TaxID=2787108 RepID=UPI0018ABB8AC|nr:phage major tail tube protein [Romboutsia sp. 1001713B170131_170501_G6]